MLESNRPIVVASRQCRQTDAANVSPFVTRCSTRLILDVRQKILLTVSYQIDPNEPSEEFLRARDVAGSRLQEMFRQLGGRVESQHDFRWIKADLTWPSFDHLTFAYKNQVFSVLVDLVEDRRSMITSKEVTRCIDACTENNLVPCIFPVDKRSFSPLKDGWNLLHPESGAAFVPEELVDDVKVEMSEWELHNFGIQIVRDHIEKSDGGRILSFCDVIGIDPQIWFEDAQGNRSWVIVRHFPRLAGEESKDFIGVEKTNSQLASYDGFFAGVSVASSEPFTHDLDAKTVPLSKRFDGSTPVYRGDGFYVNFKGIERIHVA